MELTILKTGIPQRLFPYEHAFAREILVQADVGTMSLNHSLFHELNDYVDERYGPGKFDNKITLEFAIPGKAGFYYLTYHDNIVYIGVDMINFKPKSRDIHSPIEK